MKNLKNNLTKIKSLKDKSDKIQKSVDSKYYVGCLSMDSFKSFEYENENFVQANNLIYANDLNVLHDLEENQNVKFNSIYKGYKSYDVLLDRQIESYKHDSVLMPNETSLHYSKLKYKIDKNVNKNKFYINSNVIKQNVVKLTKYGNRIFYVKDSNLCLMFFSIDDLTNDIKATLYEPYLNPMSEMIQNDISFELKDLYYKVKELTGIELY